MLHKQCVPLIYIICYRKRIKLWKISFGTLSVGGIIYYLKSEFALIFYKIYLVSYYIKCTVYSTGCLVLFTCFRTNHNWFWSKGIFLSDPNEIINFYLMNRLFFRTSLVTSMMNIYNLILWNIPMIVNLKHLTQLFRTHQLMCLKFGENMNRFDK